MTYHSVDKRLLYMFRAKMFRRKVERSCIDQIGTDDGRRRHLLAGWAWHAREVNEASRKGERKRGTHNVTTLAGVLWVGETIDILGGADDGATPVDKGGATLENFPVFAGRDEEFPMVD